MAAACQEADIEGEGDDDDTFEVEKVLKRRKVRDSPYDIYPKPLNPGA
jgi:hypothetical protein